MKSIFATLVAVLTSLSLLHAQAPEVVFTVRSETNGPSVGVESKINSSWTDTSPYSNGSITGSYVSVGTLGSNTLTVDNQCDLSGSIGGYSNTFLQGKDRIVGYVLNNPSALVTIVASGTADE